MSRVGYFVSRQFLISEFSNLVRKITGRHPKRLFTTMDTAFLLEFFTPKNLGFDLIRIGPSGDGGYVIPNLKYSHCLTLGVAEDIQFEIDLAEKNRTCSFTLVDGTIQEIPKNHLKNVTFIPKLVKSFTSNDRNTINLDYLLSQNQAFSLDRKEDSKNFYRLLKMDIEGWEYQALSSISDDNLNKVDVLLVEFHYLFNCIFEFDYKYYYHEIFSRLYNIFDCAFVNVNNHGGYFKYGRSLFPNVIEVTFVKKGLGREVPIQEPLEVSEHPDLLTTYSKPIRQMIFRRGRFVWLN
jgi:hypothetical protein